MSIKPLAQALIILGLTPVSAQARLGGTTQQCDQRYGERLFKHKNGDLSYGMYNFSGKKIRVLFLDDKSVLEMIATGPEAIYSQEQGAEIGAASMKFMRGLLAQAYGFTDDQLQGLANMQRASMEEAKSAIENKTTRVSYSIKSDQAQSTVKITATIVDIKAAERSKELGFGNFMGESVTLELKKSEANDADGF